ncbi:MAG: PEP-CTERM sorting domain-containing protein [Planctomycetaceae bacterium]|jgi:hypothetical protein|nr:PEP-CTERM sorting domain-containing protein [Planctomycetaceae bacterium]
MSSNINSAQVYRLNWVTDGKIAASAILALFLAVIPLCVDVRADIVVSGYDKSVADLLYPNNSFSYKAANQQKLYAYRLFPGVSGSKFPYTYEVKVNGEGIKQYRSSDADFESSTSNIDWSYSLDNSPNTTINSGSAHIVISGINVADLNVNFIQFYAGMGVFSNLLITTYGDSGQLKTYSGGDVSTNKEGYNTAFIYNPDDTNSIFDGSVTNISISLDVTAIAGKDSSNGDGNLIAGYFYIIGDGDVVVPQYAVEWSAATTTTPEPATLLIFGFGLAGLGLAHRRKR